MRIDPHAWLLTVPLTVILVQLYLMPSNSIAKRCWRHVTDAETLGWEWLGWRRSIGHLLPTRKAVFCMIVIALMLSSVASFAVFIGLLPGR